MFLGSIYPITVVKIQHDETGTSNSKMATAKPEIIVSQFVDMITRQFQRLEICFWERASQQSYSMNHASLNWKWDFQNCGRKTGNTHISASTQDVFENSPPVSLERCVI